MWLANNGGNHPFLHLNTDADVKYNLTDPDDLGVSWIKQIVEFINLDLSSTSAATNTTANYRIGGEEAGSCGQQSSHHGVNSSESSLSSWSPRPESEPLLAGKLIIIIMIMCMYVGMYVKFIQ